MARKAPTMSPGMHQRSAGGKTDVRTTFTPPFGRGKGKRAGKGRASSRVRSGR